MSKNKFTYDAKDVASFKVVEQATQPENDSLPVIQVIVEKEQAPGAYRADRAPDGSVVLVPIEKEDE